MIVLCVAFILDLLLGDPLWMPHPVIFMGKLISRYENLLYRIFKVQEGREEDKNKKLLLGTALFFLVILSSVICYGFILYISYRISGYLYLIISSFLCYQLLAARSLFNESMKVYEPLKQKDIVKAREMVGRIVGRDTKTLDYTGVTKACVETIAENTSDGVIAPMFFMALFGPIGGVIYKAVNTMDSMVGYKNDKYLYFGRFCAKADDVFNFIPARITGLFMVIVSVFLGLDAKNSFRIYMRDRRKHKSPNSAHGESAVAGALHIELLGDAIYFGKLEKKQTVGDPDREIEAEDIVRTNKIMLGTSFVGLLFCLGFMYCISLISAFIY